MGEVRSTHEMLFWLIVGLQNDPFCSILHWHWLHYAFQLDPERGEMV
jgi:hypothetical protein